VRIVNLRIRVVGRIGQFATVKPKAKNGGATEPIGHARIRLGQDWADIPRYRREDLQAGEHIDGPFVVEELSTRIVGYGGDTLNVRDDGTITVTVGEA
jgi:N-methylhydantoinase A/oxoprolinase/acetone carboxylase beta subunit